MTRGIVFGMLIGVGALSHALAGAQQPPAAGGQQEGPKIIEVEKLKENLFVLKGGGGNTALVVEPALFQSAGCGGDRAGARA